MKKLSIKEIVVFRNKSDKSKKSFVSNIKLDKQKTNTDGGGDYWVSCLSAITNTFRSNDLQYIIDKKGELEEKVEEAKYKKTKTMYQRNIEILYNFENADFAKWKPSKKLTYIKKSKEHSTLSIKDLELKVSPNYIFTYQSKEVNQIGTIWFIAQLKGFSKEELGMFADILYRYLKINFSKEYSINSKYCIAVDVFNNVSVSYSQLESGEVSKILSPTLEEIRKLM